MRYALITTLASALACLLAVAAFAVIRPVGAVDLEAESKRGAIGLHVPGAGPTVTRDSAERTLFTGTVESSLNGGVTDGGADKLDPTDPGGLQIVVELPPPGESENTRYALALRNPDLAGHVLTSDSTRITGLISLGDFASETVRTETVDDPVATLRQLERRIERNDELRLPLTITIVVLGGLLALLRPALGPRVLLLALAVNLWLAGWWAVALIAAVALVAPLPAACAGVLVSYLLVAGIAPEAVALSPLGPSQAGRFYGFSNLLSTLLLAPVVLGALGGRVWFAVCGLLGVAAVGLSWAGADGGGLLVVLAALGVLALLGARGRLGVRNTVLLGAVVVAAGVALVALDAALGGSSHVTSTVGDGPGAVLSAIGERLELSWNRVTAGPGPVLAALLGLAGALWVATFAPRVAAADAVLVALAVSLLVNDTPGDVLGPGATVAYVAHRYLHGRPLGRDTLTAMRKATLLGILLLLSLALLAAGCGGGEEVSATPETVVGEVPTAEEPSADEIPALALDGDAANGESIYESSGCGSCHTLAAAGSNGAVGPNLDESKPSRELTATRITKGQGGMPSFESQLSAQEIADVTQFVVDSTGG